MVYYMNKNLESNMMKAVLLISLILVISTFCEEFIAYQSDFPRPNDQWNMISGLHYRSDHISTQDVDLEDGFTSCIRFNVEAFVGTIMTVDGTFSISIEYPLSWTYYEGLKESFIWYNENDGNTKINLGKWHHICLSIDFKYGHFYILLVKDILQIY